MKIKENFMLRKVADTFVVVPVGPASAQFRGMINLNEAGAYLWKLMEVDTTEEAVLSAFLEQYEVDEETAKKDLAGFIAELRDADLFE